MATDLHRSFQGAGLVNRAAADMAAFLDGADRVPAVQAVRAAMRSVLLDRVRPAADIALVDAACGTGTETRTLAAALRGQRVVGLDHNRALLDLARARALPTTDPANGAAKPIIEWLCADVRDTGLPESSVAAVRIERGLIYLPDPRPAVAEFARVLAPGGIFVGYELDYGGLLLPVGDAPAGLMREINAVMEASLPSPWTGRRLARWAAEAGLTDVTVTPMNISAGPVVADRIVGDTVKTAVAEGRLRAEALDWLDTIALEPPGLPAITVVGFVTAAVKA